MLPSLCLPLQATLRPEIQLLNRLLGADTQEQRQRVRRHAGWGGCGTRPVLSRVHRSRAALFPPWLQILFNPDAVDTLQMNDRYFFGLLERMRSDVGRMPDSPQKAALVERLSSIRQAADAAVAGA